MSSFTITKEELQTTLKQSVREVISEELMGLRASLLAFVSAGEQQDIEALYDRPTRRITKVVEINL